LTLANLGYALMYVSKYFSTKGGVTQSPFLAKLGITKLKKISYRRAMFKSIFFSSCQRKKNHCCIDFHDEKKKDF
jgi:hypothetical protein